MRIRPCRISACLLAGFLSALSVEELPLAAPAPVRAQADSSRRSNGAAAAVAELYQQHCAKCHGKDGTGNPGRNSLPDIPDFCAASWQAQRTDAELQASILEGKGDDMPAFAKKIKEEQGRDLVAHVRAFAMTKKKSRKNEEKTGSRQFEDQFSRLQKEMDELRRQFRKLSESSRVRSQEPSEPAR